MKPLEWVDGLSKHVAARAPIPFMNDCYTIWSDFSLHGCKDGPRNEYPTLEAAKAAAQADYEARILAAIEPAAPTVADDWNAAIRAAATICNRNYGKGIGEVHAAILALLRPEDQPADAGKPIAAPTVAEACADQWGGWAAEESVA
ncbi:hypothetical protein [Cereibacter ovatus]|uniref:hypothetical protein n=1 Tax=Cereibacter ovatus TaxID=439529 RepID=UPI000BE263B0|nr:hypothetical protein [Cereibacter ovatus]